LLEMFDVGIILICELREEPLIAKGTKLHEGNLGLSGRFRAAKEPQMAKWML
jgi:hypothetical protein